MGKVLIVSTSLQEQELLQEVYSHHNTGQFSFETTASFGQPAHYWFQSPPQVLILNMPEDPGLQSYYFEKLRADMPVNMRIIFLCSAMTQGLMEASTLFERVRLIKTPVTGFFLYRAVIDITTDYPPNQQQLNPRYLTDQPVLIRSSDGGGGPSVEAQMKNLSIGGAFFELQESTPTFKVEENIKMTVELAGIRSYQFDARIVWRKLDTSAERNKMGYGCAFLNKEAVYDSLLAQVAKAPAGLY